MLTARCYSPTGEVSSLGHPAEKEHTFVKQQHSFLDVHNLNCVMLYLAVGPYQGSSKSRFNTENSFTINLLRLSETLKTNEERSRGGVQKPLLSPVNR